MPNKPRYEKLEPIDHILRRPDTYVGSKRIEDIEEYVFEVSPDCSDGAPKEGNRGATAGEDGKLVKKHIQVSPAFVRIFQEILSNAVDNIERPPEASTIKPMSYIHVSISDYEISVTNDGAVIPIEINEYDIYNPTLIFGNLLSGSNYNDEVERFTVGRNGLGAKLTNVLSVKFTVECLDPLRKVKFSQTWENNMKKINPPEITPSKAVNGYTKITWVPDFKWFNMEMITLEIKEYLSAFVLNASLTTGLKKTTLDIISDTEGGEKICSIKLPNKYDRYFSLMGDDNPEILKLEDENSRVLITSSDTGFEVHSFVNGLRTRDGGTHVNAWLNAVFNPLLSKLNHKDIKLTTKDLKPFFRFVIITRIGSPEFDSQEKNRLTLPVKVENIPESKIRAITKWSVWSKIKMLITTTQQKAVGKMLAVNKSRHPIIDGYDKANHAGGPRKNDCSLIVCEGLSAKTFCVEGIRFGIDGLPGKGRDFYGIYPLKGKILNTRNASPVNIGKNAVIVDLITILGLDYNRPTKLDKLNYGRLIIITDADTDGIHIEGLLLNFFQTLFPELLKIGFVLSMKTPLVKIGNFNKNKQRYFYDSHEWNHFIKTTTLPKNIDIKYHKGLGTIKASEIGNVFGKRIIKYKLDKETENMFIVAFDKNHSEARKHLIAEYSESLEELEMPESLPMEASAQNETAVAPTVLTTGASRLSVDFFNPKNKTEDPLTQTMFLSEYLQLELPKFYYDDCKRSLPHAIDGLKESQRKIVYTAKLRGLHKTELKVAQFAAAVAEKTAYHHGEQNLANTIINLAQSFVGSNNIPFFTEGGGFGSRLVGGKDAASPRYIFTKTVPCFTAMFPEEEEELLTKRQEDGEIIEPHFYTPTLPVILINGAKGIGTGWSSSCPMFKPSDVLHAARLWMESKFKIGNTRSKFEKFVHTMMPWYRGFTGKIARIDDRRFVTSGKFETKTTKTGQILKITELPIGEWTSDFVEWLLSKNIDHDNRSTTQTVDIEIKGIEDISEIEKKLTSKLSLENITVFDELDVIKEVDIVDIFDIWGEAKIAIIAKRKASQLDQLAKDKQIATIKSKFIVAVKRREIDLTSDLQTILSNMETITTDVDEQKILLDMNVRSLTYEKHKSLQDQIKNITEQIKILSRKNEQDLWEEDVMKLEHYEIF